MLKSSPSRVGITLVEVLVVLGILAILIALIVPAIQIARAHSDKLACAAKLRQIGIALHG
jgi:type II secretory pathway pseudopilin PulG